MKEQLIIVSIVYAMLIIILLLAAKILHLRYLRVLTRTRVAGFLDTSLIILSFLGVLTTLLWDFNYLNFSLPIEHREYRRITLNDFKGLNRPTYTLDGESDFAFISTSISTTVSDDEIEIKALFHPCRSYVYNRNIYSNSLLNHEMYHFHITEYCARLMRKEAQRRIEKNQDIELGEIAQKMKILENELQQKYDDEAYHGYVLGKQLKWQNRIDSFLVSLEDYSNTNLLLRVRNKR